MNDNVIMALYVVVAAIGGYLFYRFSKPKKNRGMGIEKLPDTWVSILEEEVLFYKNLDDTFQNLFRERMVGFLNSVDITPIKTELEDRDYVYIAAGAIIPIFAYPEWEYQNLNEVLIYPDAFSIDFVSEKGPKATGIVGEGSLENKMVLSQKALRMGFENKTDKHNVAIHEFIHLIDKMDGKVDGIPETLIPKHQVLPWMNLMYNQIEEIKKDMAHSSISPYGAKNKIEFFSVVGEYFFERPQLLKNKHPEVYDMLEKIFQQKPAKNRKVKK